MKDNKAQPAFIICGLFVQQSLLFRLTHDFITLKQQFNPTALPASSRRMDWIRKEVKGTDLRSDVSGNSRRKRRHAIGYLDKVIGLLEQHDVRLVGRVFVKASNQPVNHVSIYSNAVQYICEHFENWLRLQKSRGLVIIDSRSPNQNIGACHSIFTQKFKGGGDAYPNLVEAATFGHSDNHAGLQLADLVCSALLWPMAMHGYCEGKIASIHARSGYWRVGDRYGDRIRRLQHRYRLATGQWDGGISVSDRLSKQSGSLLFKATPPTPPAPPAAALATPPVTPP